MAPVEKASAPPMPDPGPDDDQPGVLEAAVVLILELRGAIHDQLELAALEAQLAARSLTTMIAAAVGIGVLLVTAWLAVMGATVLTLIRFGVSPAIAMLALAALNVIAAPIPYRLIQSRFRRLGFPSTLHALKPARAPDTAVGKAL